MVRVTSPSVAGAVRVTCEVVAVSDWPVSEPAGADVDQAKVMVSLFWSSWALTFAVTVPPGAMLVDDTVSESMTGTVLTKLAGGLTSWAVMTTVVTWFCTMAMLVADPW